MLRRLRCRCEGRSTRISIRTLGSHIDIMECSGIGSGSAGGSAGGIEVCEKGSGSARGNDVGGTGVNSEPVYVHTDRLTRLRYRF